MVLDLTTEVQKSDEEKLADKKRNIFTMLKMAAIQIKNSRDNVRNLILDDNEFEAETIRAYIGEADCAKLDEIDAAASALLDKVIIEKPKEENE